MRKRAASADGAVVPATDARRIRRTATRSNAIRTLLAIATYDVVYAPGSAGTIQEVFMDAAQNYYETFGPASLDRTYWTETKPVYPLLETLAEGTAYEGHLTATDDVETAVSLIEEHAPAQGASERSSSTLDP
jgi:hypothetical protein